MGFTLIELLIVIVIMGLLMSLVAPAMFSKVGSSKQKTAQAQMQMLSTALDTHLLDTGNYPSELDELRQSTSSGWDGHYLPRDIPKDPWGNSYEYKTPGTEGNPYALKTFGRDGKKGGEGEDEDIIYQ